MSKNCPKCGKSLPDDAKFCMDCGYSFSDRNSVNGSSIFSNGKIFLVIIAVVLIVGGALIITSGNNSTQSTDVVDDVDHVDLAISDVLGYDGTSSYTLYTEAIFLDVPDDMKGYLVKTSYCDENGTVIGSEMETLDDVYYDSNYALSFGHYTSHKKLDDADHVKVEIIKGGKTVDEFSEKIDKNKIDFLS